MTRKILLLLAFGLAACGKASPPQLSIEDAWARETAAGQQSGAAYFTIRNAGGTDDKLLSVQTEKARMAMIHSSSSANGVATMRMLDSLDIPAGASMELRPGGTHVMLEGLTSPLGNGERFQLKMKFEKSGDIAVPVTVQAAGAR